MGPSPCKSAEALLIPSGALSPRNEQWNVVHPLQKAVEPNFNLVILREDTRGVGKCQKALL